MSKVHEKLIEAVTHRAGSDRVFRQQLLARPAAAIHEAYGVALPAGFRVSFVEKPADLDLLVVLPDACAEEELTDEDLEDVAGGGPMDGSWAPPPPPPLPEG
ncbi:MAG TPA: NHLP leader peptide family RiPP precursor [Longimicrobium sp.]|nr:NHLP leader peptide family RiPP precursor [Longimicrobium sp.]